MLKIFRSYDLRRKFGMRHRGLALLCTNCNACGLDRQSDSAALLSILGFEVLLKCAIVLSGTSPKNNHKYAAQWSTLPESVRNEILNSAVSRMPGYTDFSDLNKLLIAYQFAFEKGRYHYEFFKDYSLVEQFELSQFWMDLGAPLDEALVQYEGG